MAEKRSRLGWLLCKLRGHAYYRIAKVSASSDHIGCRRCSREWGMNHDARALIEWSEVRHFYEPWPPKAKPPSGRAVLERGE